MHYQAKENIFEIPPSRQQKAGCVEIWSNKILLLTVTAVRRCLREKIWIFSTFCKRSERSHSWIQERRSLAHRPRPGRVLISNNDVARTENESFRFLYVGLCKALRVFYSNKICISYERKDLTSHCRRKYWNFRKSNEENGNSRLNHNITENGVHIEQQHKWREDFEYTYWNTYWFPKKIKSSLFQIFFKLLWDIWPTL